MIPLYEKSRKGLAVASLVLLALGGGCSRNLVARALDARGGPLESYRKEVDATVFTGVGGEWTWELAYRVPESFRWSLQTLGEEQSLFFDGSTSVHSLGGAQLPPVAGDAAARSQARWFAITSLDILEDSRVTWSELSGVDLPPGSSRGLTARFADDPSAYELFFDDRNLLARARGQVSLEPIGTGLLDATFADYRAVDGYRLPFSGFYRLDGQPLMRESVRSWEPNDPSLVPGSLSGQ